jgi:chaperonin GroEL
MRGVIKVAAMKAPAFGDNRKEILKDIAAITGGTVISKDLGLELKDININLLGNCDRVTIKRDSTVIVGGKGSKESIDDRVKLIDIELEDSSSKFTKDQLNERKGKLVGGVAVMYIGAGSEIELKEIKDRVTDALNATKAAVESGYVPGGGITLFNSSREIAVPTGMKLDWLSCIDLIKNVSKSPIMAICKNAGISGEVVISNISNANKGVSYGYDAREEKYGDMIEMGVIDPTKVVKCALLNAVSIASTLLTTECVIANEPEETKDK